MANGKKTEIKEEDYYSPADKEENYKLVHSCSKPDSVTINGSTVSAITSESKRENSPWLIFNGFLREAEIKIASVVNLKSFSSK